MRQRLAASSGCWVAGGVGGRAGWASSHLILKSRDAVNSAPLMVYVDPRRARKMTGSSTRSVADAGTSFLRLAQTERRTRTRPCSGPGARPGGRFDRRSARDRCRELLRQAQLDSRMSKFRCLGCRRQPSSGWRPPCVSTVQRRRVSLLLRRWTPQHVHPRADRVVAWKDTRRRRAVSLGTAHDEAGGVQKHWSPTAPQALPPGFLYSQSGAARSTQPDLPLLKD